MGTGFPGPLKGLRGSDQSPQDQMDRVEVESDSGCGSISASSEGGFNTPETGTSSSSEQASSFPEDRFSLENVAACERVPEASCRFSASECPLDQEDGGDKERALSPPTKRFKTEEEEGSPGQLPGPLHPEDSLVDIAVDISKKIVPLHFSMRSLSQRVRQLQHQQQQREGEQNYRKFRAKICPGENQAAEEELRKEIR